MQKERNEARRTKANLSKETRKDRKRICEIPKKEMKRTVKSKYFPHNTILVFDTSNDTMIDSMLLVRKVT